MAPLDEEDFMILRALQREGRISYAELSRRTGIPDSTVHDKIERLVARGVIRKFAAILNGEKVGVDTAAIIGLETGAKLYHAVAKALCEVEEVVEVYGTTAEFDLMIKIRTSTRDELSRLLNRIRRIDGVDDIYVSSILETFKEEPTLPLREPLKS
ncbi:MAG: Lrp/AsnC family transcriptional regulator [Candidatus Bathyarchaeia archaeon]